MSLLVKKATALGVSGNVRLALRYGDRDRAAALRAEYIGMGRTERARRMRAKKLDALAHAENPSPR